MNTDMLSGTIQPPRVGALAAIAHIRNIKSQLEQFLARIDQSEIDCHPLATVAPQLAILVEQHRIHITTKKDALEFETDHYRFALSFAADTRVADVAIAFENGAIAHLASIQLQVGLVNQMGGAGYAADSWELQTVLDDIGADARMIGRMVAEARHFPLPSSAEPANPKAPIRISRRTRMKRADRMSAAPRDTLLAIGNECGFQV